VRIALDWMCGFVYSLNNPILISCLLAVPSLPGRHSPLCAGKRGEGSMGCACPVTSTSMISLHTFPARGSPCLAEKSWRQAREEPDWLGKFKTTPQLTVHHHPSPSRIPTTTTPPLTQVKSGQENTTREKMKLLTLNFLTCARKSCKSSPAAFPLHPKDAELEQVETEMNAVFLRNILPRLEWEAMRSITTEVTHSKTPFLPLSISLVGFVG